MFIKIEPSYNKCIMNGGTRKKWKLGCSTQEMCEFNKSQLHN